MIGEGTNRLTKGFIIEPIHVKGNKRNLRKMDRIFIISLNAIITEDVNSFNMNFNGSTSTTCRTAIINLLHQLTRLNPRSNTLKKDALPNLR